MKRILFLSFLLLSLVSTNVSAQWINGFTIDPSNPTENDTVKIYAHLSFSTGSCNEHTQSHFINGTDIDAYALHCLGALTVICDYTDTFFIGQLTGGTYHFTLQIDAGGLPSPCTPGIVAGPQDSITFEVSKATDVPNSPVHSNYFSLYPNPAHDELVVDLTTDLSVPDHLVIYSLDGRKVFSKEISGQITYLSTASFASGVYFAEINKAGKERKLFVVQH